MQFANGFANGFMFALVSVWFASCRNGHAFAVPNAQHQTLFAAGPAWV
ncbi:MAG: hypothetical protein ACLRM9_00470 [Collinsella aerofaciens]